MGMSGIQNIRSQTVYPGAMKLGVLSQSQYTVQGHDCNNLVKIRQSLIQILMQYITLFNIFSPYQFGFRKKLSTVDAVNLFNSFISNSFNNKTYVHATLCDLSRAFECLNHEILLHKLSYYKFHHNSIKLIKSYLENRVHIVKLGEHLSEPRRVNVGIPTGSILGPLIFLLYINDLPANLPEYCSAAIFADDTTLFVDDESEEEAVRKGNIHSFG